MMKLLALALCLLISPTVTTVPIDTGWQLSTDQLYPNNPPTFQYLVQAAPAGTTSVTACLTIEGHLAIHAENLSSTPIWGNGGVSQRTGQSNDAAGQDRWWNPTSGAFWEIPASNPLQPGESRTLLMDWSSGPVCLNLTNAQAWISQSVAVTKYGQFDDYRPNLCNLRGQPVNCSDYKIPVNAGFSLYILHDYWPHGYQSEGRLHGWMEYQ